MTPPLIMVPSAHAKTLNTEGGQQEPERYSVKIIGTVHRAILREKEEFKQILAYIKRKEVIKSDALIVNKLITELTCFIYLCFQ